MRENYGLYCYWDVNNNCFVAFSPSFELCRGRGETHAEAVASLHDEVQEWINTGHELGANEFDAPARMIVPEQVLSQSTAQSPSQKTATEKPNKKRNSLFKTLKDALEAAQEASLDTSALSFTITSDPWVVHLRGEITLFTLQNVKTPILGLAEVQDHLILDLTEVTYIDSAGFALLVEARKRIGGAPASLSLVITQESSIGRTLQITRLNSVLPAFYSLEEAVAFSPEKVA